MFAGPEGALELKVFAAPRNGDLWSEVRPQIAADLGNRGGTATERDGRFGTELVCQMPVTLPDGKTGLQPSRVIGINGPRWLLRATLLGRPAVEPDAGTTFEDALTTVAVRRGRARHARRRPARAVPPGGRPQERRLTVPDPDESLVRAKPSPIRLAGRSLAGPLGQPAQEPAAPDDQPLGQQHRPARP